MTKEQYFYAIGRRKTSSAQVKLFIAPGESSINGKPMNEYVHRGDLFGKLLAPLKVAGLQDRVKFEVEVAGGGEASQVDAIAH